MSNRDNDKIAFNFHYSNSWWVATSMFSRFFSYTEKFHAFEALRLIEKMKRSTATVLDVGFGSGFFLEKCRTSLTEGSQFIGFDISLTNVAFFRRRCAKKLKKNIYPLPLSPYSSKLPLADRSIDCVFCSHVLEHVPDDRELLQEIHRILRPQGCAVFMIPVHEEKLEVPTHLRKYQRQEFLKILADDFEIQTSGENDVFSHWIRCLALSPKKTAKVMKKVLIFTLSFIPHPIVVFADKFMMKWKGTPSQLFVMTQKA
jgi:ubiquinone/menaquinone biosynthesis C-methylase UbiE